MTDQERLWKDLSGNKLALRFPNVSVSDEGVYTCFAQNMLTRVGKTFRVQVLQHGNTLTTLLPLHHKSYESEEH